LSAFQWVAYVKRPVRRVVSLAVVLAAALLTIAWRPGAQTVGGRVVGQVTNGSPDAEVPDGLVITLHVFSGMEEIEAYTTTLTVDSAFRFDDVAFDEEQTLVARTLHDGVTYVSEFVTPELGQQELQLPITIYETTEDPASIAIAQLHIFVNRIGEQLEVGQYCLISNTSDRTYVGAVTSAPEQRTTWSVALPEGAENLRFDGADPGGRFVALDDGFADTRPLLPGSASVEASFTYDLPYSQGLQFEQVFDVSVNSAVMVLPEGDLALQGAQLSAGETLDTQMGPALSYTAGPLDRGQPLAFTIVPRPSDVSAAQPVERSSGLAVGIAALAAAGVATYWMWRPPAPGPAPAQLRSQLQAIAALDRDYEAGLVAENQYRKKRRSLKRQLNDQLSGN
jgi:hypothetical protein